VDGGIVQKVEDRRSSPQMRKIASSLGGKNAMKEQKKGFFSLEEGSRQERRK